MSLCDGPCLATRVRGAMVEIVMPSDSKRWADRDRLSGPVAQRLKRTETGKRARRRKNPVQAAAQPDDSDEENDSPHDALQSSFSQLVGLMRRPTSTSYGPQFQLSLHCRFTSA